VYILCSIRNADLPEEFLILLSRLYVWVSVWRSFVNTFKRFIIIYILYTYNFCFSNKLFAKKLPFFTVWKIGARHYEPYTHLSHIKHIVFTGFHECDEWIVSCSMIYYNCVRSSATKLACGLLKMFKCYTFF